MYLLYLPQLCLSSYIVLDTHAKGAMQVCTLHTARRRVQCRLTLCVELSPIPLFLCLAFFDCQLFRVGNISHHALGPVPMQWGTYRN